MFYRRVVQISSPRIYRYRTPHLIKSYIIYLLLNKYLVILQQILKSLLQHYYYTQLLGISYTLYILVLCIHVLVGTSLVPSDQIEIYPEAPVDILLTRNVCTIGILLCTFFLTTDDVFTNSKFIIFYSFKTISKVKDRYGGHPLHSLFVSKISALLRITFPPSN